MGIKANQVSLASVLFAMMAFALCLASPFYRLPCSIVAVICIQLRLLCNLIDGMIAIEHGQKSKTGELYNDVPDRFADFFIIVGAGYSIANVDYAVELSYIGASIAILTAYIRVLGASLGVNHIFSGSMAKPQRMFILSISLLVDIYTFENHRFSLTFYALIIIAIGGLFTTFQRLRIIAMNIRKL